MDDSYSFARPQGYDGGPAFLDGLGKLFVSIAVIWSLVLCCGIGYLYIHRRQPCVRIRNLPLAASATACLHVYWVLCMLAYSMNGTYPCVVEYWIMSIYLPMGIALFQANNIQLLSVACLQERMLSASEPSAPKVKPATHTLRRYWLRFNNMNLLRRTEVAIGIGMVVQLVVSLAIFLASRKFSSFGSFGESVSPGACRRGAEWVPSIVWQLTWAWFFAPFVLWKIRHINDIHHWRRQTTVCIIAGLPGSPLWLAALYSDSPTWAAINKYWLPPLWFAPGIMAIQAATILAPCVSLKQTLMGQKYVVEAIRDWENRRGRGDTSSVANSLKPGSTAITVSTRTSGRSGMHSKDALEQYMAGDIQKLLDFAVHKEFTGENITFLVFVRQWKAAWSAVLRKYPDYDWERDPFGHRSQLFKVAVEMYADLVEVKTARFPINIESFILLGLRRVFGDAAKALNRPLSANVATPFLYPGGFDDDLGESGDSTIELVNRDRKGPTMTATSVPAWPQGSYTSAHRDILHLPTRLTDPVIVPRDFSVKVFDRAQDSVTHMVLHNTWPRFVDECARAPLAKLNVAEKGMLTRIGDQLRRASRF